MSATASTSAFSAAGGVGTLAISSARECTWAIGTDAPWIVPERASGQGEASLRVSITANGTPNARRGAIVIGLSRIEIAQDGAPCRFDLDATQADIGASGGNVRIGVTAMSGCNWSARAVDSWISVTGGAASAGNGVVELSIAANAGAARRGAVNVANQVVTVTQQGRGPGPTPPGPPGPGGGIELDGRVSSLRGTCPNLTFALAGTTVVADSSTKFREGNCKHVEEGRRVVVVGERQADGRVTAERIDIKERD